MQKVLAVMSDLFFSAKINDAAKKLGTAAVFVKDKSVALEQFQLNPPVVIFDLNCAAADPLDLLRTLKKDPATRSIPTIGFISHVQTALREEAQAAGCDTVVARSVFDRDMPTLLGEILKSRLSAA
jgi:CheY-like chemotaxis protein